MKPNCDPGAAPAAGPINLLIVDDEPGNLVVLETLLDDQGYRLVRAESAEQALLALLAEDFALLILDIGMPGTSGLELARMIKRRKKTAAIPIIFLTAYYNEDENVLEGYDTGAVDYLPKPVNAAILRSKVAVFAELHRKNLALLAEVAERHHAEELLRESVEDLEAFSYSIAHDLRGPLRAMQGLSGALIADHSSRLDDEARDYLQRIDAAAGRMDVLIVDILAYSRIARGELTLGPVDVERLIHEIIASNPVLQSAGADLAVKGPLPRVRANEAALTQVLSNLLCNAVKFVAPGVRPRVGVRATEDGGKVQLWFEDNGIGIPKCSHEKLFKIFVRLNPPKLYEGTGIGLAIVRKAVERMGGSIGLESEEGQGSRFWVRLKKVQEPAREPFHLLSSPNGPR